MLSKEDNELYTRVGPGTPMGQLLREYWMPFLHSSELPAPDCPPLRARLLGEDLIAFRDTAGRVGLLAANCPHRGASLFFGRNEEWGLRCVYHGWKFDVAGQCVDMPSEPPESNFKNKIRLRAYPCQERGGVVWAYMGSRADPPPLSDLVWFLVPPNQRFVSKRLERCSWTQAFEGGIDSSHSSFLHSRLNLDDYEEERGSLNRNVMEVKQRDRHPRFEVADTDFGVWVAARRDGGEATNLWRMTPFLMPFYTMTPGNEIRELGADRSMGGHAWVPMDDEHTITWSFGCHFQRPYRQEELDRLNDYPRGSGIHAGVPKGVLPPTSEPMGAYLPIANASNDYLIDYEAQRTKLFCGILNLGMQDQAMQESMGPIYDRRQEHLGSSDAGVIKVRRRLLDAARALRDYGTTPPGVDEPWAFRVQSAVVMLPREVSWLEGAKDYLVAEPGAHYTMAQTR